MDQPDNWQRVGGLSFFEKSQAWHDRMIKFYDEHPDLEPPPSVPPIRPWRIDPFTGNQFAYDDEVIAAYGHAAGIPPGLAKCAFDNFVADDGAHRLLVNPVRGWVDGLWDNLALGRAYCLLLHGGPGRGKSHLAVSALKALIPDMIRFSQKCPRFVDVAKLNATLRNFWGDDIVEELTGPGLVLFDDLGADQPTPIQKERLRVIMTQRCDHLRPMIITTNLGFPDGLKALLGDRMISRIWSNFQSVTFSLSVPDWREHGAASRGQKKAPAQEPGPVEQDLPF